MNDADIRVVMSAHGRGEVFLNGQKLEGVNRIKIDVGVDQLNIVHVEFATSKVSFDGLVDLTDLGSYERRFAKASDDTT